MMEAATMRSTVEELVTRLLANGEIELAEQLVHPELVNNEAVPERRDGPSGVGATSGWLRSCFGDLRYDNHRIFVDGDIEFLDSRSLPSSDRSPNRPSTGRRSGG